MSVGLSLIVIAYNCADSLEACLDSVKGLVDEMIVVDSGSTDDTVARAERLGARVIAQEWLGYAQQKNIALDHAKHEWILWMDSDEVLTGLAHEHVQRAVRSSAPIEGYELKRRTQFLGEWLDHCCCGERVLRLFKNHPSHRFEETPVHECIHLGTAHVREIPATIEHFPYPDMKTYMSKFVKYAELYAQKNLAKPVPVWKLVVVGPARFVKLYILKRGFLDGLPGFIFSTLSAAHDVYKYALLWESQRRKS